MPKLLPCILRGQAHGNQPKPQKKFKISFQFSVNVKHEVNLFDPIVRHLWDAFFLFFSLLWDECCLLLWDDFAGCLDFIAFFNDNFLLLCDVVVGWIHSLYLVCLFVCVRVCLMIFIDHLRITHWFVIRYLGYIALGDQTDFKKSFLVLSNRDWYIFCCFD